MTDDLRRLAKQNYRAGKFGNSAAAWLELLADGSGCADDWNSCGAAFRAAGDPIAAIKCYRLSLQRSPAHKAAWSNLGNALADLKRIQAALECHRYAVSLNGEDGRLVHNYGVSLMLADRNAEAVPVLERAMGLLPSDARIRWDLARAQLHIKDYKPGWDNYEARQMTGDLPDRTPPGDLWKGQRYDGARLLIVSEQGLGDAIWAARYLSRIKASGGTLSVECRPELLAVFRELPEIDELIPLGSPLPEAQFHCYMGSVPQFFPEFPAGSGSAPYLIRSNSRAQRFEELISRTKDVLNVGIVWSGSTTFKANNDRAAALAQFIQSFVLPGVQLYSLQKGPPANQLKAVASDTPIIDLAPHLADFADTAAAVCRLDLIIMTDSSVAHLSGALGKPIWLLLSYVPHWLWGSNESRTPWYPSMRLFRQRSWGDWTSVFDVAAEALIELTRRRSRNGK